MKLSEDRIKSGINHPEQLVRDAAVSYFCASLSRDRTIMPAATQAVDKYGWQHAFADIEVLQALVQTDATISWLVNEFARVGDTHDMREWEYLTGLSWILADADATLLKRRRRDVLDIPLLESNAADAIRERTRLCTVNADACWQELETFCQRVESGEGGPDQNLERAFHLVEAVSRHPDRFAERALAILSQDVDPNADMARAWLQLMMIRAVGQMRLTAAVPQLVAKLQEDAGEEDWVHEECAIALTRIGGDRVVKAVWNAVPISPPSFLYFATWVLESVHSELAVQAALYLFQQQEDLAERANLGHALLAQFDVDAIAPVRRLVVDATPEQQPQLVELRDNLLAVCTLLEAEIPELDGWRKELQDEKAFRESWQTPEFPVVDTWSPASPASKRQQAAAAPLPLPKPVVPRVGRNEPCPCNSGKKYKNCCLRRSP